MKNSGSFINQTEKLKKIIKNNLIPLINNDYIYLDLPFYTNIGDLLIWKGTKELLKILPYKCLYKAAIETYIKPKISKDIIILLQGGGNFGDIWRRHAEFFIRITKEFPENKIIILPQTVYYKDKAVLKADAMSMGQHPYLTICARDMVTYQLLCNNFLKNKILLVPDMSFYISQKFLNKYREPEQNQILFFKRKDKELQSFDYKTYLRVQDNIAEREWPSMEKHQIYSKILFSLKKIHPLFKNNIYFRNISAKIINWYAIKIYMPLLIKMGIKFISNYKYIYTTRLHGAILCILLQKPFTFFDNLYGKNIAFYNTWFKELKDIKFVKSNR
jgi:exopolysaccharide biosynthesis predicted pyruvyltransferase EpsI